MRKVVMSNENLKTLCRQLVKIEIYMAANNGDTLVEAVISAKWISPDQDNEKNSNSKTTKKLFKRHHQS